jgi:hypothetical protein
MTALEQIRKYLPENRETLPRTIQMIYVAAKLNIADLLHEGVNSLEELASRTQTHAPSLYRLLRALGSHGIFAETAHHHFELTPMAEYLRSDIPGSLHNEALWQGEPWLWQVYGGLLENVKTGETAFNTIFGMGIYDYLEQKPEAAHIFDKRMAEMTLIEGNAVPDAYDFSAAKTVVDIGGGRGILMRAILQKYAGLHGILFDRPSVVSDSRLYMGELSQRCEFVGGDFFESVPEGGDIYLLKDIVHNWDDEQAIAILKNCRRAMKGGKLLLVERVIFPGNDAQSGKVLDISMMLLLGGRERTEAEYRQLLQQANFQLIRIIPAKVGIDIVEAVPVEA